MRALFILSLILLFLFCSCSSNQTPQPNTPSTFEQSNSGIYKKRGYQDVVEGLYLEVVENSHDLKNLEEALNKLNDGKSDSLSLFQEFDSNNKHYYSSVEQHLARIKDSLLRTRIKDQINNSLAKYETSIGMHRNLVQAINQKEVALSDLHVALKLTHTLPVMETYQRKNIPSTRSIQGLSKQLDETMKRIEKLMKHSTK